MARVILTSDARVELEKLPSDIHARVQRVLIRLTAWPTVSGAKPLRGALAGYYRVRTGDYRVQFRAIGSGSATVVTVVKIGHRDGFYDE